VTIPSFEMTQAIYPPREGEQEVSLGAKITIKDGPFEGYTILVTEVFDDGSPYSLGLKYNAVAPSNETDEIDYDALDPVVGAIIEKAVESSLNDYE